MSIFIYRRGSLVDKRSINTSINTIENKDIYIPNIPIDNKDVVEHKPSNK